MLWDSTSTIKHEPSIILDSMDNNDQFPLVTTDSLLLDRYQTDLGSIVNSLVTSTDGLSALRPSATKQHRITSPLKCPRRLTSNSSSSLITFDRDPAATETTDHLTDELRWLLIQYGPHQPRDDEDQFLASAISTNKGKGNVRFRSKWFDDPRFSEWLEYSSSSGRAYCFHCRLFVESNRNRAFSRDGIKNWRKCMGSRGQKKRRTTGTLLKSEEDSTASQRRGLLESHAMSEAHRQCRMKYFEFVNRMHFHSEPNENHDESK